MATALFYPAYLTVVFVLTLIFFPRKVHKEYFIYGLLIGGSVICSW